MANRKIGDALKDRLEFLKGMPKEFTIKEFSERWNMRYDKASWTVRSMVECYMLTKGGTRRARVYIQP